MAENNEQQNNSKHELRPNMTVHEFFQWTRDILAEEKEHMLAEAMALEPAEPAAEPIKEEPLRIHIDTPDGTPNSPDFDAEVRLHSMGNSMHSAAERLKDAIGSSITPEEMSQAIKIMSEAVESMLNILSDADFDALEELEPFLLAELEKPQYSGKDLLQLWEDSADEKGECVPGSLYDQAVKNARAAMLKDRNGRANYKPILRPTSYTMPNAKPASKYLALQEMLTYMDPDGQLRFWPIEHEENKQPLRVRNEGKKKKAVIDIVSLSYYGDLDGKAAKIKSYDQAVYNGISSLIQAGNNVFLVDDIYKAITQKTKPTEAQLNRIKQSMQKFAGTRIRLDVTQEVQNKMISADLNGERITNNIIEDALLHYRTFTIVTDKGTVKDAIEIISEPILYYYSRIKKEIISIPVELLELPGKATEETISLRDYLLREINQLKKGFRHNDIINYDNLLKYIGVDFETMKRTEKSRITATICDILDSLREKNFIKGYEVRNGARNKVLGFRIIY